MAVPRVDTLYFLKYAVSSKKLQVMQKKKTHTHTGNYDLFTGLKKTGNKNFPWERPHIRFNKKDFEVVIVNIVTELELD